MSFNSFINIFSVTNVKLAVFEAEKDINIEEFFFHIGDVRRRRKIENSMVESNSTIPRQTEFDSGEPPGARTQHLLLKRQLLYRMS